jgi:predicted lipoprotein with Yx(FWY)xxD motif
MAVLLAVLLLSVFVISGGVIGGTAAPSPAAVVKVAFNKKLKKSIVVDGSGRTVYMFAADTGGTPNCTVKLDPICPKLWPPVKTVGAPRAGKGISASKLSTTKYPNGVTQVRYNRHPLYYFSGCCGQGPGDRRPGDARGQGFFQQWYVLSPKGTPIRK